MATYTVEMFELEDGSYWIKNGEDQMVKVPANIAEVMKGMTTITVTPKISTVSTVVDFAKVRAWAMKHPKFKNDIKSRGRIPEHIIDAYNSNS